MIQINNFGGKTITLNRDFAKILGIDVSRELITNVKRLRYPTSYFIHCDLIDRKYNFFNNKKSDLLGKIDVKGLALWKSKIWCFSPTAYSRLLDKFSCEQYQRQRSRWWAFGFQRHATWIRIGVKLIFYLYHVLKRSVFCASWRIKSVSTSFAARLQNAKS